jgi:hypothetical protein
MPTVYGHEDFGSRNEGDFYVYNSPLRPVSLNNNAYVRSEGYGELAQIADGKLVVPSADSSTFVRFSCQGQGLSELDVIIVCSAGAVGSLAQYGPDGIFSSPLAVAPGIICGNVFRCSFAIDATGAGYLQSLTNPEINQSISYAGNRTPKLGSCLFDTLEGTIEAVLFVSPDYVYGPAIEPTVQPFWTNLVHCKQSE